MKIAALEQNEASYLIRMIIKMVAQVMVIEESIKDHLDQVRRATREGPRNERSRKRGYEVFMV